MGGNMRNMTDATMQPLELAIEAMKQIQTSLDKDIVSHQIDRCIRSVAGEYARKRDFTESFTQCEKISSRFWLIRTLMDIGCEMLEAGEQEAGLTTIDLAWENAREQDNGFPEVDLLPYLDTLKLFGHKNLISSILKFALARVEINDHSEFRLRCYCLLLPYLAVHWREMAEQIVDYILSLPSGLPGTRDENLTPSHENIFDVALEISRHDLRWTVERENHFRRHLSTVCKPLKKSEHSADDS